MSSGHREPEAALVRAIAEDPRHLDNYRALAAIYRSRSEHEKAALSLRRALELDPACLPAWIDLGILCSYQDWQCAADAFERACALQPRDPGHWLRRGGALLAIHDLREASRVCDRLLEEFPGRWEGSLLAGHIHRISGRADEAIAAYRRVLDADPDQTDAWYNLAELAPAPACDSHARHAEALRRSGSLAPRDSANVCFGLARVRERAGRFEEAMSLYREANAAAEQAMRDVGVSYEPQRTERETAAIIRSFEGRTFTTPLEPLDLDMTLIFITGMPRAGTTLVERIIGSHPEVTPGGELPFMQECLSRLLASRQDPGPVDSANPEDRRLLHGLRERYLDGLFERDLDGRYVTDKLPANFAALGLIRVLFPNAVLVHCSRDTIATCWSLYRAHFGVHLPYHTRLDHLAHYYRDAYLPIVRHWRAVLGDIVEVTYEDLVEGPEDTMRGLIAGCGLPWAPECARFFENEAPIYTASMQQARRPISSESIHGWRRFEPWLAPLLQGLGTRPAAAGS